MKQRFDVVLRELEQERQRVDEDLKRITAVAGYMRAMLPAGRHRRSRRRCTPRH